MSPPPQPAMRFATTVAKRPRLAEATAEATAGLTAALGGAPDLVFCFAAPHYGDALDGLPGLIGAALPDAGLLGCSALGVIGGGLEIERRPAVALIGARLPRVQITPFLIDDDHDDLDLAIAPASRPIFVVLPDPFTTEPDAVIETIDRAYPGSVVLGGLASGARRPGDHRLFLGGRSHRAGAVGVALTGDLEVETVVAQGCRPVGQPMFATRVDGGIVHELDGRPALTVLEELTCSLGPADRALVSSSLFLGIAMREQCDVYRSGDFLIRNLIGVDPDSGAIAAAASLEPLAVVQFHLRDAAASTADLRGLLAARDPRPAAGALLFSCVGRGACLFGEEGHDSRLFRETVGDVPLGGFFCNGEIGQVQGRTYLHGYTSSFGLFRPR